MVEGLFQPEEWKRIGEINLHIYHKCQVCGKFMRRTKTPDEKLRFGNYKCVDVTYNWEYGWEHE